MIEQTELFPKVKNKNTCGKCVYIYKHEYNNTKYCKLKFSSRTSYGNAVVKSRQEACSKFEASK